MPRVQPAVSTHTHLCVRCNYVSPCLQPLDPRGLCIVHRAVKVNKSGPFCNVCMHVIMAKRYAAARRLSLPALMALIGDITDVE